MPGPLLEIDRLGLEVPGPRGEPVTLLRDLSLRVLPGETLGLVGESGAGKSSLLRTVLGLEPPGARRTGRIRFEGREVAAEELAGLRGSRIALVFQEPSAALNPVLTIGEQVAEVLRAHRPPRSRRETREWAWELLARVGLRSAAERAGRYPHQLSGGECQRAMIAMALAGDPALLLADEPTSALDPTLQAEILDLLRRLKDRLGLAMVWVSHDLGVVASVSDRVAVLYAGERVEEGSVADILERPSHPYTRALVRCSPRLGSPAPRGRIPTIEGRAPEAGSRPEGCAFHPRCADRLEICARSRPDVYREDDGRPVRCFLHLPDAGASS